MARKLDQEGDAYRKVLGFTFRQWKDQPWTLTATFVGFMAATILDVLTPLYAGRLVEAVAQGGGSALNLAIEAFVILIALGLGAVVMRQFGFMAIIQFTPKMMADTASRLMAAIPIRVSTMRDIDGDQPISTSEKSFVDCCGCSFQPDTLARVAPSASGNMDMIAPPSSRSSCCAFW